jgi:PAS domain S-box-containing protein
MTLDDSSAILSADAGPIGVSDASDRPATGSGRAQKLKLTARWLAWLAIALGCLVLLGWVAGVTALRSLWPGHARTTPGTALAWTALGAAILLAIRRSGAAIRLSRALAAVVCVAGLARVVAWAVQRDIGIDAWLLPRSVGANSAGSPPRMALNSALCFVLCGMAAWLLCERRQRGPALAQALALLVSLIALFAIVGHAVQVPGFYDMNAKDPMAAPTATALLMLSIALLLARPDEGLMAVVTGDGPGSTMARRLIPPCVILPIIIGGGLFLAQRLGLLLMPVAFGLSVLSTIIVLLGLIWGQATLIENAERRRQRAVEDLRRSELFFHTLVETLPQNILRKDASGRFTFANRLCAQTFGRQIEEVVGKTDMDLFPPALAEKYRADDQRVMLDGTTFETVEEHITPDGQTHYVHVIKTPLFDAERRSIGIQGIFWDVTATLLAERRLREQNVLLQELAESERHALDELKQAQGRMVESAKLAGLGQMVAGVAHEINNPLAFVLNNIVVLERDLRGAWEVLARVKALDGEPGAGGAEARGAIRALWDEADLDYTISNLPGLLARTREGLGRIQRIVRDLRVFARVEEDSFVESDVNEGIESTVHILLGNAKTRGVKIDLALAPLPPLVCQPAKLNQVIMNLVSNAIEACGPGGRVSVASRAGTDSVSIEVVDNGSGIDPAARERIFDPFFTTKPIGEGTGLGLSISYGIVKEHGGTIDVISEPGRGARFTVKLPMRAAPAASYEKPQRRPLEAAR